MCIGEKRTLTIGPNYAYGNRDIGIIPAGSTLGSFPPSPNSPRRARAGQPRFPCDVLLTTVACL